MDGDYGELSDTYRAELKPNSHDNTYSRCVSQVVNREFVFGPKEK